MKGEPVGLILLILILLIVLGSAPTWPHSRTWGYGPSGTAAVVLVILLMLILFTPWVPWGFGPPPPPVH